MNKEVLIQNFLKFDKLDPFTDVAKEKCFEILSELLMSEHMDEWGDVHRAAFAYENGIAPNLSTLLTFLKYSSIPVPPIEMVTLSKTDLLSVVLYYLQDAWKQEEVYG